jgi:hypothetical protein
MTVPSFNT